MVLKTLYYRLLNYNLFIPDENDYDEQQQQQDPINTIKYQKYSTRLYILLLFVFTYILFYTTMINPQIRTVVILNIDSNEFIKLNSKYGETLSCPCSKITTSYKTFVSNTITFHPICSSFFINQQWIEALYLPNRSKYGVGDFRTTAVSQFQLLSSLCSLSQDITFKNEIDLNNKEFATTYLLSESKIQLEINATTQSFKNSLSTQIISFINYLRLITRANNFVTSINTNVVFYFADPTYDTISGMFELYNPEFLEKDLRCDITNPITPTAFYLITDDMSCNRYTWTTYPPNSTLVKGFFSACIPLEALLESTFDCLYDTDCLQLLSDYFPSIKQINLNFTDYVLKSEKTNETIYNHLSNLFIEHWISTLNYSKYFNSCNPSICTYTTRNIINYSYAITLFISLYGGLTMIFRLISPIFIKIIFKFKRQSARKDLIQWLKNINLFKNIHKRTEQDIKQQKIISYTYLSLLILSTFTLILFNFLNTSTTIAKISNPSLDTYINLQRLHSNTLRCPCSNMTIPYHQFTSLSPILHQICSSDFISDRWISILKQTIQRFELDWRNQAYQQFNLLSQICRLANETLINSINEFLSQSFVISNMISEIDFNIQLNKSLIQFYQTTIIRFSQLIEMVDLSTQVNQFFMVKSDTFLFNAHSFQFQTEVDYETFTLRKAEINLSSNFISDIYSKLIQCICSTDYYCQRSSAIFDVDIKQDIRGDENFSVSYVIPGSIVGCSNMNSLLFSNMECFYINSSCFSTVINSTKETYQWFVEYPSWIDINPLVYNSNLTHFNRNDTIAQLIKQMMIEQWNTSYSYNKSYYLCSPPHCIYEEKDKTKDRIEILIIIISTIGGLTQALHLFTPILFNFLMKILSKIFKKQEQNAIVLNWRDRLKFLKIKLITLLYNTVINLNIFPPHNFGNHIDQRNVKHLGQQTTRLYFILLLICFSILTIYTITQQQILSKDFNQPSFDYYNQLIQIYGQHLKCTCSSIAITYDQFVEIKLIFHPICSNEFITNLSSITYDKRDYRRILSAHIQYLQGLCRISINTIENTKKQFLSTLFQTKQLLSNDEFKNNLNSSIEYIQITASNTLTSILFLIRNIHFGNAIISTYETNFKYYQPLPSILGEYLQTEAIIYDKNCSCALNLNCTSQAYIFRRNSSEKIAIKGLKIGCLPSESFLLSTLECFYDISCMNTINLTFPFQSFNSLTRKNQTIEELIQILFTEQWLTIFNYSSYFHQCLPSICSYSYIQKFNIIYIISFLLGLQGGLTIVLKWICPKLVQFISKIKKHSNIVHSEQSVDIITTVQSTRRSRLCLYKYILPSILLLIIVLIIFSVYIARQRINKFTIESSIVTTTTSTTTTTYTTTTTRRSLIFEKTSFEFISPIRPMIINFNNDNQLDISFVNFSFYDLYDTNLIVLSGNGNGSFDMSLIFPIGYFSQWSKIAMADLNQDHLFDIILINTQTDTAILTVLTNENGSFKEQTMFAIINCSIAKEISIADVNNDTYLDITLICYENSNIRIYFGYGNGSFSEEIMIDTEENNRPQTMTVADFNGDGHSDIAFGNTIDRTIGVLIGYGNGSFEKQKKSFSGGGDFVANMNIGDFNGDGKQDIVISYVNIINVFRVMFGNGDGTFSEKSRLTIKSGYISGQVVIKDFDRNGDLDFAIVTSYPYTVVIFFGDGNGQFERDTMFSTEFYGDITSISAGDFNDDRYPDIITTDTNPGSVTVFLNTRQ